MTDIQLYLANPHYSQDSDYSEDAERLEACEAEAMRLFRSVTKAALVEHSQTMVDLMPYAGSPRWDRGRDKAERKYEEASKPAWALYRRCVSELMIYGEISPELDAKLTAIRDAKIQIQQAAE